MFFQDKRGFTLIEMIVAIAIFLTIIMITATAFKTIVDSSSQQTKSVETQIEGIVGLEVLRADLEEVGFGLPWTMSGVTYGEATSNPAFPPAPFWTAGVDSSSFNDAPGNPPRAVLSGNTAFNMDTAANIGSNYLVVKSTLAVANGTSKKWTTISYDKDGLRNRKVWGTADRDFTSSERVIIIKNSLVSTPVTRQLVASGSTAFSGMFSNYSSPTTHQSGDTFEIYGVNPNSDLRMPFNRADYYVTRPVKMPAFCSDNTGILYKSTVIQGGPLAGTLTLGMPLLDCVADMQVVYGLDTSGAGFVNSHTSVPLTSAEDMRNQLREIRVYILAQEGRKDLQYSYPSTTVDVGESFDGDPSHITGRRFDLQARIGSGYKYYRWKVYTIVVRPKNLIQ